MKKRYKIVIDTNVFISALKSNQGASFKLIKLIEADIFDFYISVSLILEYEDVANRDNIIKLKPKVVNDIINYICMEGIETKIFYLWRPFLTDPKDDFVLELAISSNADFIITHNKRDFLGTENFGVGILTPYEFLKLIGELK